MATGSRGTTVENSQRIRGRAIPSLKPPPMPITVALAYVIVFGTLAAILVSLLRGITDPGYFLFVNLCAPMPTMILLPGVALPLCESGRRLTHRYKVIRPRIERLARLLRVAGIEERLPRRWLEFQLLTANAHRPKELQIAPHETRGVAIAMGLRPSAVLAEPRAVIHAEPLDPIRDAAAIASLASTDVTSNDAGLQLDLTANDEHRAAEGALLKGPAGAKRRSAFVTAVPGLITVFAILVTIVNSGISPYRGVLPFAVGLAGAALLIYVLGDLIPAARRAVGGRRIFVLPGGVVRRPPILNLNATLEFVPAESAVLVIDCDSQRVLIGMNGKLVEVSGLGPAAGILRLWRSVEARPSHEAISAMFDDARLVRVGSAAAMLTSQPRT